MQIMLRAPFSFCFYYILMFIHVCAHTCREGRGLVGILFFPYVASGIKLRPPSLTTGVSSHWVTSALLFNFSKQASNSVILLPQYFQSWNYRHVATSPAQVSFSVCSEQIFLMNKWSIIHFTFGVSASHNHRVMKVMERKTGAELTSGMLTNILRP